MTKSFDSNTHKSSAAGSLAGTILCRIVVPLWLLAGAVFKLMELDWKLLPPPVRSASGTIGELLGQDPEMWLDFSMRFIIGSEIALAVIMLASARLARPIAIFVLSLFVLILVIVLGQGYDAKTGLSSLFAGDCGCFGSSGPPPIIMLAIDGVLLALTIYLRPRRRRSGSIHPGFFALCLLGFVPAFAVPERTLENSDGMSESTTAVDEKGWLLPPTTLKPNYFPQFKDWLGKPLKDQELAQLLPRPLPAGIAEGDQLVIFYRGDCDHCQEMFLTYFSAPELETPVLAVDVMDYDVSGSLEFYCEACDLAELPTGPSYLIQTPVVLRLKNGIITCVGDGASSDEEIESCIYGE
jgi:hypothetical protein